MKTAGVPSLANGAEVSDADLKAAAALASSSRHPYAQAVAAAADSVSAACRPSPALRKPPGPGSPAYPGLAGTAWVCILVRRSCGTAPCLGL